MFDFMVHRQAEGGFNLVSDAYIYKKHTIENIAVVRILNHFTFTLPWIHVARTGYLSSWRKCIFFDFRPNLTYSYIDVKIVTSSPISHIS